MPNPAAPPRYRLPYDLETGVLVPDVWDEMARPGETVNMVDKRHMDALKSSPGIRSTCGTKDEFTLHGERARSSTR